jgi:hypothetical protein
MKTELKVKDNLTLLPTFLEVGIDEVPDSLSELQNYYSILSECGEVILYPSIHDSYIYNDFLPYLVSRLITSNVIVSIIVPCSIISYVSSLSVKSIIVCDSSQNIIKATRFLKNLTKYDTILINKINSLKQILLIKKQLVDNEILTTLAIKEGLLEVEDLKIHQIYTSKLGGVE